MAEAVTTTILEDVVVLAMGRTTEVANTSSPTTVSAAPRPTTQAATLLVSPEQARKLELAKNQGKISLALRNPLDHSSAKDQSATTSEQLYAGFHPKSQNAPNLRDDRAWERLIAKPPEKKEIPAPRHVIDVYRGDKHVQEIFQ
jgi:Flp pilus assembly protein CpaB